MRAPKILIEDLRLDYVNDETGVRHLAVEHLDLDVRENEFLCVVGPSGCGKSTLIAAIAGFLKPVAGRARDERTADRAAPAPTAAWCSRNTRCCRGRP